LKGKQQLIALTSVILAGSVLLAACGGNEETNDVSNTTKPVEQEGPLPIIVFARQNAAEAVAKDNPLLKELEKRTNTDLNITWVPVNTLAEKTKITISSGDIPEMMYIENVFDSLFVQAAFDGAFWDLTPYIKDFPNLSALPQTIWDNSKIQGKNYVVPRPRPLEGGGSMPLLRKDWLDKLGLPVPETIDEFYEAAKAFTEKDPDGNGKADTYGIAGDVSPNTMGSYAWIEQAFTRSPSTTGFLLKDGELSPAVFDPGIKSALEFMKKAYEEKVIPADFAVMKNSQARDAFMGNKAGMLGSSIKPQWLFTEALRKIEPEGDIYPVPYITGPLGKYAQKDIGYFGSYAIPKKVPEEKMKKILAVLDKGLTPEVGDLASYGLKDVHYKVLDGDDSYIMATEQAKTDNISPILNNLANLFSTYNKYSNAFLAGIPKDLYDRNKEVIDEREKVSVSNPSHGLISETYMVIGPDLEKKIQDLKVQIIMNKEPLSAWDEFVDKLKTDPQLQKATAEMNEAYKNK
jgi:putative aldouronate transport system substrate-binding protein